MRLLTLRPLASAAKAAKGAAAKTAVVGATRAEKVREDAKTQGQGNALSPTFACARVLRAPALYWTVPVAPPPVPHPGGHQQYHDHHHQQQARALAQAQKQQGAAAGRSSTTTIANQVTDPAAGIKDKRHGLEISKRIEEVDNSSSGSEHELNSVCLAEMVIDYIEEDLEMDKCGCARCNCGNTCSGGDPSLVNENDGSKSSLGGGMADVLMGLTPCASPCERSIYASVTSALQPVLEGDEDDLEAECDTSYNESDRIFSMRRSVMATLRFSGYNAAICRSRWRRARGFPAGDYEIIDVILEAAGIGRSDRILVDIDFKAQFEIARPTNLYRSLLQLLPPTFVGKLDRLLQIVQIMCYAAKRSFEENGMHLPPWRRPEYIRAKWFLAYRMTTFERLREISGADASIWANRPARVCVGFHAKEA